EERTALAEALERRDRDLTPGLVADAGHEVVAVARRRLVRPLAQAHDLLAEGRGARPAARRRVVGRTRGLARQVEEGRLVRGVAARDLVHAQVVVPALEERDGRRPRETVRD